MSKLVKLDTYFDHVETFYRCQRGGSLESVEIARKLVKSISI